MSEKIKYAMDVQAVSTLLIQAIEALPRITSVWADRGYGSGEANEMTDTDVESLGIAASQIGAFITPLATELTNFANNLSASTGDYSVSLNKLRTDV